MHTERLAGMPEGHARRACPEGAQKGPRRCHGGCRLPGSACNVGRVPFPPPQNPPNLFSPTIIPEEAAGRQGVLEGGGSEEGSPHTKNPPNFFHPKLSPKRQQAGDAAMGCGRGGKEGLPSWGPAHECVFILNGNAVFFMFLIYNSCIRSVYF